MPRSNIISYTVALDRAKTDFPRLFGATPVPRAIGTFHQIHAAWPDLSKSQIGAFLAAYCKRKAYLEALVAGRPRFALDGTANGAVTEEEQKSARERLETRHARCVADFIATRERGRELKRERRVRKAEGRGNAAGKPHIAKEAPAAVPVKKPAPEQQKPILCGPTANSVKVLGPGRKTREAQTVTKREFNRAACV